MQYMVKVNIEAGLRLRYTTLASEQPVSLSSVLNSKTIACLSFAPRRNYSEW